MRAVILAGALAFSAMPVLANQCNVELNGNLQLENNILQIALHDGTEVKINQDKHLYIDERKIPLNHEQQIWVTNYYDGINQAVPQAAGIATDAVALASSALNEVFTELLGSDSNALIDLSEKLQSLDDKIQYSFYAEDGTIRLHSDSFENGEFFGQEWEEKFEDDIEELVTGSIGHIMVAVGKQLIFGGGDMEAFEQRMEHFGQQIEEKVEYQAEALEDKADLLCSTLMEVDIAENQLKRHISQLSDLDVIQMDDNFNAM